METTTTLPEVDIRENLQNFVKRLNKEPNEAELGRTPDGKARTVPISFVEMTLDEYFFGLWETSGFQWAVVANEVVGSIELTITHPVTGQKYRRTGAASIVIMVDKGANALDINAKKSNALDMGFPKLKAECVKNAAQSLGKLFGRDLNRKQADVYQPLIKTKQIPQELTPEHQQWEGAKLGLGQGNVTIDQLRARFSLSKENEKLLTASVGANQVTA